MTRRCGEVYVRPFIRRHRLRASSRTTGTAASTRCAPVKAADDAWDLRAGRCRRTATGCGEGLFEKLDWSAIGGKDHYLPHGRERLRRRRGGHQHGPRLGQGQVSRPRPTWADFWDVAKYPGQARPGERRRAATWRSRCWPTAWRRATSTRRWRPVDGVDRAFRKLDQLKPYIVWWQTEAEAARILGSGDVLMTSAPSGSIAMATRADPRNFGMQWAAGAVRGAELGGR